MPSRSRRFPGGTGLVKSPGGARRGTPRDSIGARWSRYLRWFGARDALRLLAASRPSARHPFVQVRPPGYAFPIHLRGGTSDPEVFGQVIAARSCECPLIATPSVIVDAGANIGLVSVFYALRYPRATIYAIEPEEGNFAVLEKNSAPYPSIVPIRAALWSGRSILAISYPGLGRASFRTRPPESRASGRDVGRVESLSVQDLIRDRGIDRIDLLKIDIEGAEREVFAEPEAWIGKVDCIVAELHDRYVRGCSLAFYGATRDFEHEWHSGELVTVMRKRALRRSPPDEMIPRAGA